MISNESMHRNKPNSAYLGHVDLKKGIAFIVAELW